MQEILFSFPKCPIAHLQWCEIPRSCHKGNHFLYENICTAHFCSIVDSRKVPGGGQELPLPHNGGKSGLHVCCLTTFPRTSSRFTKHGFSSMVEKVTDWGANFSRIPRADGNRTRPKHPTLFAAGSRCSAHKKHGNIFHLSSHNDHNFLVENPTNYYQKHFICIIM